MASPEVRAQDLSAIREAITEHVRVLPERNLLDVLCIVADDLFKAGNRTSVAGGAFDIYLEASAGTLFALAKQRNCILHYLVDNIYEQTEFGMRRPLELYENWFRSAGLVYICPQAIAISLMIMTSKTLANTSRSCLNILMRELTWRGRLWRSATRKVGTTYSSTLIVPISRFPSNVVMKIAGSPGIVTALRTEAPVVGSKISIIYPQNHK